MTASTVSSGATSDVSATAILTLECLSVSYGSQQVLENVSFSIGDGECVAVVGHNGAGKTTLLRAIAGLAPVKTGKVVFRGTNVTNDNAAKRVSSGIVLIPQGRALFPDMSIRDNVELGAFRHSRKQARTAWTDACAQWGWMSDRSRTKVALLSGGQQQLVANARGLAAEPDLLMVDEPSVGLSGVAVSELADSLQALKTAGRHMILVEQNLGLALKVCDRFFVIREGRFVEDYARDDLPEEGLWTLF